MLPVCAFFVLFWNTLTAIVWMQTYVYVGCRENFLTRPRRKDEKKNWNSSGSFCSTCKRNVTLVRQRCQFIHLTCGRATWSSGSRSNCPFALLLSSCFDILILRFLLQFLVGVMVSERSVAVDRAARSSISLCHSCAASLGLTHLLVFVC